LESNLELGGLPGQPPAPSGLGPTSLPARRAAWAAWAT